MALFDFNKPAWRAKDPNDPELWDLPVPDWNQIEGEIQHEYRRGMRKRGASSTSEERMADFDYNDAHSKNIAAQYGAHRLNLARVTRENSRRAALRANYALQGQPVSDYGSYAKNLNAKVQAIELETGKPARIQSGPDIHTSSPSIADSPDWWLQGEPDPREVTAQTIPTIRRNLDKMPASLRALYAERFKQR